MEEKVASPPLAPLPARAFPLGWARRRRAAQWWCLDPNPQGGGGPTSPCTPLSARCAPKAVPAAVWRWGRGPLVGPLSRVLCTFRSRVRVRVSDFYLPFRFEIEFFLLFIYLRLDLRPNRSSGTIDRIDGSSRCRSSRVQDCDCVYVQSNACEYKEMVEERCTVSGRGAAGSASHVGDLRLGSDAKCSGGGGGASRHWLRSM
jgi:hypothetical protein